jgi:dolichyl-phosphate beta-glucosyltransferase
LKHLELSVVIPAFNESQRLGKTLEQTVAYLKQQPYSSEIWVVNDGSTDATSDLVKTFIAKDVQNEVRVHLISLKRNGGKGAAVRTGVLAAQGDVVLFMDADNSTPVSEYEHLVPFLHQGLEVVIGSRALREVEVKQPLYRQWMGKIFNVMVRKITVPNIQDTQCGFKAFQRETILKIFPYQTIQQFGFDVELLFIARKRKYRIQEVPVIYRNAMGSKVHPIRDAARMFLNLFEIRFKDFFGKYQLKEIPPGVITHNE